MPTARSLLAAVAGAVLLLGAVAALSVGRQALREALPVLTGPIAHVTAWAAIAGGVWLLVHAWNHRHPQDKRSR